MDVENFLGNSKVSLKDDSAYAGNLAHHARGFYIDEPDNSHLELISL